MGDYRRSTRGCKTTNEKTKKSSLFGKLTGGDPDPTHYVVVVVTPHYLIWARSGAKYGVAMLSARLQECELLDYANTPEAKLAPDSGLEVTAMLTGATERAPSFIGLGPEPAAQNLRQVLKQAMQQA